MRKSFGFLSALVILSLLVVPVWQLKATLVSSSTFWSSGPPTAKSSATGMSSVGTTYPWPMFRYNPAHTGYTPSPGPKTNRTLWKRGGLGHWLWATPTVVDGVVYVTSYDDDVRALNATTGAEIWHYRTGAYSLYSSPAVVDGVVYVGASDNYLYALNATTGAKIWRYRTGEYSSPVRSSPAVVGGVVYGGTEAQSVYALNATTGTEIWEYRTEGLVWSSPAVVNGVVYIGSGYVASGYIYALNATTGAKIWKYKTGDIVDSSPAVADGIVYIGSWDSYVYALDAINGTMIWKYKTGKIDDNSPAVADGIVYIGSTDGMVHALNATTGNKIWQLPTGDEINSSPAVADGVVYIGSDDNHLYALNATTGAKIWVYSTGGNMYSPSVSDGVVFVGSSAYEGDYALYAIGGLPQLQSPAAEFTYSPLKPFPRETVTFDASASEPGWNGTHEMLIISYEWDFGDGFYGEGAIVDHVYTAVGNYTVTLNVTDNQGLWNTKSKMITVSLPPPYSPTAKFFYLPFVPSVNKTLTFYISDYMLGWNGTHNVPIANYTWDFGDGNITTTPNSVITHIYVEESAYTVNLTITCQDDPVLIEEGLASNSKWRNITIQLEPKFTETAVYLNPATITATEVGQNFTVDVCIANVVNLSGVYSGIWFDPSALECIDFKDGPFLTSGGAWGEWYLNVSGTINNIAGEIYPSYAITLIWDYTVSGSGVLFTATFRAKKTGTFNLHPCEIGLINSEGERIQANVIDVFTVIVEENAYTIVTVSNLAGKYPPRIRIYNYAFNQTARAISFEVTGPPGQTGFCNVTIPKVLLWASLDDWLVLVGGSLIPYITTENATHTFIYFTYTLSTHKVEIIGNWGEAQFTLVTLYKVNLYVNGTFVCGSSLKARFYGYSGVYEGEVLLWGGTTPDHVFLSLNVSHPFGSPVEVVTLVLTEDLGTILQTVTSFVVHQHDLMGRLGELDYLWTVPGADRSAIMKEYVAIDGQWPYAPQ